MDVKAFNGTVSAPADDLVLEEPLAAPQPLSIRTESGSRINGEPDREANEHGLDQDSSSSESNKSSSLPEGEELEDEPADDNDDRDRPESPLLDNVDAMAQQNTRKRKKRAKKISISVMIILIVVLICVVGLYSGLEARNHIVSAGHSNHNYTRTNLYTLLATFKCKKSGQCDTSNVRASAVMKNSPDPNEVKVVLTKCEDVITNDLDKNVTTYYSTTSTADTPVPIIDENFLTQNYFVGNVTIFVRATALLSEEKLPPFSNVSLCQFFDPYVYDNFVHSKSQWTKYTKKAMCKTITVQNIGTSYYQVNFTNEHLMLSFIGAVQTQASYSIGFRYSVVGKTIIGLNVSLLSETCTLMVDNEDDTGLASSCSIDVSDHLVELADGSDLCVLGRGVPAGDGVNNVYTDIAIDFIKEAKFINIIRYVFIPLIAVTFVLTFLPCLIYKSYSRNESHSLQEEHRSQPARAFITGVGHSQPYTPVSGENCVL